MRILLVWLTVVPALVVGALNAQDRETLGRHPRVVDAIALLELWIDEQRHAQDLPGLSVAVVHDQETVWARGFGWSDRASQTPATSDTRYRIGSITKVFTATAILQLRDRGALRLDDPVLRHLPDFAIATSFTNGPDISLRHLLTHTAGLPREAAFPYWTTHTFPSWPEIAAVLPRQRAVFAPASTYKYSNLGMGLLGAVVARAAGQPYADYVREHIFAPLGMQRSTARPDDGVIADLATAYMRRMPDGQRDVFVYYDTNGLAPAANIVSTVNDLARFAALQFRSDDASPQAVLRGSTLREMQRPHWVHDSWAGGRGLGFDIRRRDGKTLVGHFGWVGGNRSHLLLAPEDQIAVIVMINADDGNPGDFSFRIFDTLAPAIETATATPEPPVKIDPAWRTLVGTYTDPWAWEYQVLLLDDGLALYEHAYPPEEAPEAGLTRLAPVAPDTFRLPDGELMIFERNDDGTVRRIRRRYEYLTPKPSP